MACTLGSSNTISPFRGFRSYLKSSSVQNFLYNPLRGLQRRLDKLHPLISYSWSLIFAIDDTTISAICKLISKFLALKYSARLVSSTPTAQCDAHLLIGSFNITLDSWVGTLLQRSRSVRFLHDWLLYKTIARYPIYRIAVRIRSHCPIRRLEPYGK